jgi:flagellar basal body P-ring formation protein FlgA
MSLSGSLPKYVTAGYLAMALAGPLQADPGTDSQSPESILDAAREHLEQAARAQLTGRVEVQMGYLDPRLRLAQCAQPLETFQASGARPTGRTSVGVRCPDITGWTIYVAANVDIFGKALVTTRSLPRSADLAPGDVQLVETSLANLGAGYLNDSADIDGMVTRRPLPAGTALTPAMVKAPRLVRRGDRVTLVGGEGPIQVEMLGEAINDGARGERVRVRALNSQRIVEGWVVSASVVKVTL